MDWIHLADNGDQWQGQVNMVVNLPVSLDDDDELQLGCDPVAVVILHVYKIWNCSVD